MLHQSRVVLMAGFGLLGVSAFLLTGQPTGQKLQQFRERSADFEKRGLAEPYEGIKTTAGIQTGLFKVKSTGVSTAAVRNAAQAYLALLDDGQRKRTLFPVDDNEWRKWMNQHFYIRAGVAFHEMSPTQRDAAFGLLRASLSARGLQLSRDIMKLNHTLGELNNNNFEDYGEWLYNITIMGTPSATEPWGWQIDGHHLIVNYFVLGDQVVMTPAFFGSEPVIATSGKYKGTSILQQEQAMGLDFMNSLTEAQRAKALFSAEKTKNDNLTEAFHDNVVMDYKGVRGSELTAKQKAQLTALIAQYIGNMDDGHAKVKMQEVAQHLDETYFGWIGKTEKDSVYYYRIHSPVVLIEFDHQLPAGMRNLVKNPREPQPDHVHVVIRTPNGNDYGKDLLRQHYAMQKH
ncbi:hypothetical protein F183_A26270 [Bryobacterales bacterium F-183]|nr:hypothetical protein F183_A26270 [Bryobacterales bacterium F-183]